MCVVCVCCVCVLCVCVCVLQLLCPLSSSPESDKMAYNVGFDHCPEAGTALIVFCLFFNVVSLLFIVVY